MDMAAVRSEKELIAATKPFVAESPAKSWWAFLSTLAFMTGAIAIAFRPATTPLEWAVRATASFFGGLLIVRFFILYHDFQHGSILRGSLVARAIFAVYGVLIMTPPKVWRETHNYHHANTAKIVGSHVGSYAMVTTGMWATMTPAQRRTYKIIRHPITILFGYFTVFMLGMGISPFRRAPKKHWACGVSVLLNWALTAFLIAQYGFSTWLFGMFLPLAIAMAIGGYLFYAQHNFPEAHIQPRETWSFAKAALESSSYMKMGAFWRYFCGNIGFHHVHHLNATIPFYRLPEAMEAIPELRHPLGTTSLWPKDIVACFRQKLWDPEKNRMVGYPAGT
jgi:omega-6 fatty acid desaturase (delta-12 desaturase)